jgi:hypothetical protein
MSKLHSPVGNSHLKHTAEEESGEEHDDKKPNINNLFAGCTVCSCVQVTSPLPP